MPTATLETPLAPPEERFWKRYSPHGEAPLSISGSLAVHVLIGGALLLAGAYLASLLYKPDRRVPVEPVRLSLAGGPGPGKPGRPGLDSNRPFEENVPGAPGDDLVGDDEKPRPPALAAPEVKQIREEYDDQSRKILWDNNSERAKSLLGLDKRVREALARGQRGGGGDGKKPRGGTPGGGGDGGKLTLSKREERMLRWHMVFTANSGPEYLAQLKGLGAILAFPVEEKGKSEYKVVRDLRKGGRLLDEDVAKLNRIYWIDDKAKSVQDIVGALGLKLPGRPARFVAFMPETLEKELYEKEKRHVENVLKQKFDEKRIDETRFRVVRTARGYKVELIQVALK